MKATEVKGTMPEWLDLESYYIEEHERDEADIAWAVDDLREDLPEYAAMSDLEMCRACDMSRLVETLKICLDEMAENLPRSVIINVIDMCMVGII